MISTPTLVLLAALSAPGQTVLLDFYSDHCGPCRSMEPTIRRLIADGYAVRKINIATDSQSARKYGVTGVPTYIMIANGQELRRIVGPTDYSQLAGLFRSAPAATTAVPTTFVSATSHERVATVASAGDSPAVKKIAMQATVRLTVEDPTGKSFGTGTIIDARENEALIVTCAHIFRDSQGKGKITVDVLASGASGPVAGYLLKHDLENDVALVAIRPGCRVQPTKVAPAGYGFRTGAKVFSVGCDHGREPSLHDSQITALNKYKEPANIEVAGQPVVGRSGGGLFDAAGQLIGVCNFADPKDDEGIYAHLTLVQQILDSVNMSQVYQRAEPLLAGTRPTGHATPDPAAKSVPVPVSPKDTPPPHMPREMPRGSLAAQDSSTGSGDWWSQLLSQAGSDTEITVIIRPKQNPQLQRVFTLDRADPAFLRLMATQVNQQQGRQPTVLEAVGSDAEIATSPQQFDPSRGGPDFRAQSRF